MTSNSSSEAYNLALAFVEDRDRIWKKYDEARTQEQELEKYSSKFGGVVGRHVRLPNLSTTSEPPSELAEAVWLLKQEIEKIDTGNKRIKEYREEIDKVRKQFFVLVGVVVIGIFILFAAIINSSS